jgi:hypothetical protein
MDDYTLASKGFRVMIIFWTLITTNCQHISEKTGRKLISYPPGAGNRTRNRMAFRSHNSTCRRPLGRVVDDRFDKKVRKICSSRSRQQVK